MPAVCAMGRLRAGVIRETNKADATYAIRSVTSSGKLPSNHT